MIRLFQFIFDVWYDAKDLQDEMYRKYKNSHLYNNWS